MLQSFNTLVSPYLNLDILPNSDEKLLGQISLLLSRQKHIANSELLFAPKDDSKPSIFTNKNDYSPGETATIFGSNFDIGETIKLQILHTDGIPNTGGGHTPWFLTDGGAGDLDGVADGNFRTTWYVNPDDSLNSTFELTAIGQTSQETATYNFTDSDPAVQFFYIPEEEEDIKQALIGITNDFSAVTAIETVISITVSTDNSIIYYDHWEDGYETDINNPTQSSTETWGDNDPSNGIPPGFTTDVLDAGDIIVLENSVTIEPSRDPNAIFYDGRDKVGASKAIVISRAAFPDDPSGTLIGGAVEINDTSKWGLRYDVPIGENLLNTASLNPISDNFGDTSLFITVAENGTSITIDGLDTDGDNDHDGNDTATTIILNEGETYFVDGGVLAGSTVVASKPVQAQLLTGELNSNFASRSYTLLPTAEWDNNYYAPVGTVLASGANTDVFLYNPAASAITVKYDTQNLTAQEVTVNAGEVARVTLPFDADSGTRFYTDNTSDTFWAVTAFDSEDTTNDWGFSIVPENNLTPVIQLGWAPGNGNQDENGNPLWVMANLEAGETTTIYIDYDGDGVAPFTDINGGQYDEERTLSALEITQIVDTKNNDFDQSGIRVYTVDGTGLAGAWGQDPNAAAAGTSLDLGTTVLPLPVSSVWKASTLGDLDSDGLGDEGETITYNINIQNDGVVLLGNVKVSDIIPEGTNYVPGSTSVTYIGGKVGEINDTGISVTTNSIPDDATGTAFPLDDDGTDNGFDAGLNIGNIDTDESAIVSFQVTINDPYDGTSAFITNAATVDSDEESFTVAVQTELDPTILNTQTKTLYLSDNSGNNDLDRIDPNNSGATNSTSIFIGDSIGLVGVDFDSETGFSPPNWTEILSSGDRTLTDLNDTSGITTPYDLTLDFLGTNSLGGFNIDTTTVPSDLGRNIDVEATDSTGINATWSGLDILTTYDVYVFGLGSNAAINQNVSITGSTATSFTQTQLTQDLDINGQIGSSANTLNTYATQVTSDASGNIVINVTPNGGNIGIAGLAIEESTPITSITFNQSISMKSDFEVRAGETVTVSAYINSITGTPTTASDVIATLEYSSGSIATFSNPTSVSSDLGGGVYLVEWQGSLDNSVTVPTGEAISLDITNNESQFPLEFQLLYDDPTYPSKIDLPTASIINVDSIEFYNNISSNGGNQINASTDDNTVYIRVQVSDPFGDSDITGLNLVIDDPDTPAIVDVNLTDSNLVDTSVDAGGNGIKIYEYAWVIADGADLGDYTITATANEGTEGTVTDTGNTTFTVNDGTAPDVFIGDSTVTEGTSLVFDVTLTDTSASDIILDLTTTEGTATEVGDYENNTFEYSIDGGVTWISAGGTNGTQVTIPAGSSGIKVRIDSVSDTTDEPDETFILGVGSVVSGTVGSFGDTGTGTILDDDNLANLSIDDVTLTEGDSNTKEFTFTVTLDAPSNKTVTVDYATADGTSGTASDNATTADNDYTSTSGTLTFAPGETSKTVTVLVNGDTPIESDEIFTVDLSNATNANITDSQGLGTIVNDDSIPDVVVGDASEVEGNQLIFDVGLTSARVEDITLTLDTTSGTATDGTDYENTNFEYSTDNGVTWLSATSDQVIIPAGQTNIKVRIDSTEDATSEGNENFTLGVTAATGATSGAAAINDFSDTGIGTIIDDDGTPAISIDDVTLTEGDNGTTPFTFTVTLDQASSSAVTVDYNINDGTATTADSDYTDATGTITFAAGETSKTITVDVIGDTPVEPDETFTVDLSNPSGATISDSQGLGTILNDDSNLGSISGTVFVDTDNDDAGESPLSGVTMELLDSAGNSIDSDAGTAGIQPTTTTTDATGRYTFTDVPPEDYLVKQTNLSGYTDVSDGDTTDGSDDAANNSTTDNLIPVTVSSQESDTGNDFIDEQTGTITGEVLSDTNNDDVGDNPLEAVTVQLFEDGNPTSIDSTTTDATGNYSFTNVPPGNYTVVETNLGDYGDVKDIDTNVDGTANGAGGNTDKNTIAVALSPGGSSTGNDFVDERGVITGNVQADTTGDTNGDTNLENVTITLKDDTGATVATTTTDASGNYIFADLASGTYTVEETNPSGYTDVSEQDSVIDTGGNDTDLELSTANNDNILDVVLVAGEEDTGNDFVDEALPEIIAGKVLEDTNGDGIGDTPLAGVEITLGGTESNTASTDSNGEYSFTVSGAGTYTLTSPVSDTGTVVGYNHINELDSIVDNATNDTDLEGNSTNNNRVLDVVLVAGEADTGNDFVYEAQTGEISGTVFVNDGSGNLGKDGVVLSLLDGDANPVLDSFGNAITDTTGVNGNYSFTNLAPGDYQVVENDPAGYSSVSDSDDTNDGANDSDTNSNTNDNILTVSLGAGETDSGNNFFDRLNGNISGTVLTDTDGDGDGDENVFIGVVTVTLKDSDGNIVATDVTDSNGDYSFSNVTPGDYTVVESDLTGYSSITDEDSVTDAGGNDGETGSDGLNDNIISVSLSAGETDSGNDFVDAQNGSINGSVTADTDGNDAGDTALSGVTITLRNAIDDSIVATTTTNASGNYSFTDVPPGNYEVVETNPTSYVDVNELDSVDDDGGASGTGNTDSDNETAGADNDNILSVTLISGESDTGNDFVDELSGTISGTVTDDNSPTPNPLTGVTITLKDGTGADIDSDPDTTGTQPTTTITAADGTYSFTNLPAGDYQVVESDRANYNSVSDGDSITDTGGEDGETNNGDTNDNIITIALADGETDSGNDFVDQLTGSGFISGTVLEDTDGDGVGDTPLQNVNITLDDGITQTTIQTDVDGNYSFTSLVNGTYTVTQENLSGYGDVAESDGTNDNSIGVITINNDASTGNNFVDGLEASISGVVWEDINGNGIRGQFEDVVEGVNVTLTGGGADGVIGTGGDDTSVNTTTAADGTYSFTELNPEEQYQVTFPTSITGYTGLTAQDTGSDDTIDSDANASTGATAIITLNANEDRENVDGGLLPDTLITIEGTDSSETISGTSGDDVIAGYKGQDTLTGGTGSDTFFFNETSDGVDIITDFLSGTDRLDFTNILSEIEAYSSVTINDPITEDYITTENFSGVGTMIRADFDAAGSLDPKDVVFLQSPNDIIVGGDFVF